MLSDSTLAELCPLRRSCTIENTTATFTIPGFAGWEGEWYADVAAAGRCWEALAGDDVFVQPAFLKVLEQYPPALDHGCCILRHPVKGQVGLFCQFLPFDAGRQIRLDNNDSTRNADWLGDLRRRVAGWLRFEVLTLGQMVVSGPHALLGARPDGLMTELLPAAMESLAVWLGTQGRPIDAIMLKDLTLLESPAAASWQESGYHQLPVQPLMMIREVDRWGGMDDYLAELTSKYRVRYRRARKKLNGIHRRLLSPEEVEQAGDAFYRLYRSVATDAGFNAVELKFGYFAAMQRELGSDFRLWGYFQEDRLIGFKTAVTGAGILHAHFLGYEPEMNSRYQLYHNMLYDLLEEAIEGGFSTLDYGRTALEIKSSIGAVAEQYFCGLRSRLHFTNWLIPYVAHWLSPLPDWQARHPFGAA